MAILKLSFLSKTPEAKPWSFPVNLSYQESVHAYLNKREVGYNRRYPRSDSTLIADRIPALLKEREYSLENHDKVFASHWLSHNEVIIGSKCNKLIILNTDTDKRFEIPLPCEVDKEQTEDLANCSGIRSIAVNPSKTLLAVGAGKPVQVTVYELPSFEPVAVFSGHNDLVFSVSWLDDDHLISGSRDGTLRLWSASSLIVAEKPLFTKSISVHNPILTQTETKGKVRDLHYNARQQQIMTLSTEGYVKLWDCDRFIPISKIPLEHTNETVCLSGNSRENFYCVGSQSHISVIDPRSESLVHIIDSVDEGWGVRSLTFNSHVITTGGGYGRLSFYDLRAQAYMEFPEVDVEGNVHQRKYKQAGAGWLNRDAVYMNHFAGLPIQNAIYTMSYDDSGTKLFVGGGPLQLGLKGSYAGLWE